MYAWMAATMTAHRPWLCGLALLPFCAWSQTVVPQAGANPLPIVQGAPIDPLVVLPAASAERLSTSTVLNFGEPKYAWVYGFDSASKYLKWTVTVPTASSYRVTANLSPDVANQTLLLSVDGGTPSSVLVANAGWSMAGLGSIFLNAGVHTITLKRSNPSGDLSIKSLELLRDADQAGYAARVAAFKTDTTRFSSQKYGLMFQYGHWGYPQSGDKKNINQQAQDFNVPAFVAKVKATGAQYLIWSTTWWTYEFDAPISEISSILGNSARISTRDLIGDVAAALATEGIDFYLYYHTGQDGQLGYKSSDWWIAQNFPSSFTTTAQGDRSAFFKNWKTMVGAVGKRYGALLKGWFFDDGMVYYPAAFEDLGAAARAGNPSRLVSFNSWVSASFTEFQDVSFGEACKAGDADLGGNGRYVRGGEKGLAGHCMYPMESDWGIHAANQAIGAPGFSVASAVATVQANAARRVPSSFNLMMYEDGTMSSATLDVLSGLKAQLSPAASPCGFGCTVLNDNDAAISYTGGWGRSTGRGAGDYGDDVSYTSTDGAAAALTFTGSAIRVYMPMYAVEGNFEVFIDGVSRGLYSANLPGGYAARVKVFEIGGLAAGSHQISLVKRSGMFMQIDKIEVDRNVLRLNDDNSAITYSGSWNRSLNRGAGDYLDGVNYTVNNGDSFSFNLVGTGAQLIMPSDPNQGSIEVFVDGKSYGTYSTYSASYTAQRALFSVQNLPLGTHTITATKRSGPWMVLDAVDLLGSPTSATAPVTGGLTASYFSNTSLSGTAVLQRTENVDFDWGNGSPAAAVPVDNFSARWTGSLLVPTTGSYNFATVSDDGVRVWINGTLVIDNWTLHGPTTNTATGIALTAGQAVSVRIEYFEQTGGATVRWQWQAPGSSAYVAVPAAVLTAN